MNGFSGQVTSLRPATLVQARGVAEKEGGPNTRGPQREKPPGLTIQSPFAH